MREHNASHVGWKFILSLLIFTQAAIHKLSRPLILLISISFVFIPVSHMVFAQESSSSSASEAMIGILVSDAIKALQSGNSTKTLENLNAVNQMIAKTNSSSVQAIKILLQDSIAAIQTNDDDRALTYLNLVGQQFGAKQPENEKLNMVTNNSNSKSMNTNTNFLLYEYPVLGIKMQYPPDWTVRQYEYNPEANSTLVAFYSPSKTASDLGNISGVSGHFVPYSDIFVFDSNNMTLDNIVNTRLKRIQNDSQITAIESKPFSFSSSQSGQLAAHLLIYRTIAGGDELFKKMQVYTIAGNKVYLVSFTSQDALFPNYYPIVQKMIESFEILNK